MPQAAIAGPNAIHRSASRPEQRPVSNLALREYFERGISKSQAMSQVLTLNARVAVLQEDLELARSLQDNWDSYGAESPSGDVIRQGRDLLVALAARQILPDAIVPSAEGGIALYFTQDETTTYVEYRNSGEAILANYGQIGRVDVREFNSESDNPVILQAVLSHIG
jgi:hypothetical protein